MRGWMSIEVDRGERSRANRQENRCEDRETCASAHLREESTYERGQRFGLRELN
jgi:hypothetical protein